MLVSLHQKVGVGRTLLERINNTVTEEEDKQEEENKIRTALARCGYPTWTVNMVKRRIEE